MYIFEELLRAAIDSRASDLHLTVGLPPMMRINGNLAYKGDVRLSSEETEGFVKYVLTNEQLNRFDKFGEIDFSYSSKGIGRFRINAYKQRGSHAMAVRLMDFDMPTLEGLSMPDALKQLCKKQRGLVLVTGPTGSGKSTTLAAMINEINNTRQCHVITLEDPVEYLHRHNMSMINQRQIGEDTLSFANALRSALREDPDVILVGEMRDLETIQIALTAAETGHLVLSTLHTVGSAKTVDRIVDVFPSYQQQQIRVQLAAVIEGIISQQLLVREDGTGRVAGVEVMLGTSAIRNLIREGKAHMIDNAMQTGGKLGMRTMDSTLAHLYKTGVIAYDEAISRCIDRDLLTRLINL